MKLDRRSFIRLIPVGLAAALAGGSWWFFRETARAPMIASQSALTTSSEASQATITTSEASQTKVTAAKTSQTIASTSEASQATVRATTSEVPQTTATASKAYNFPVTFLGDRPTKVDLKKYRLKIDGNVSKPLELTVEDLYAMPTIQRTLTIQCGTAWAASVPWEGIPLDHLLKLAGTAPDKLAYIDVESVTNYVARIPSGQLFNPDNMIALKAGGLPLGVEHGYPARLVVPGSLTGGDWVKYVSRITCKRM